MTGPVPPPLLHQAPELATLALLECALQQSLYALFVAQPELVEQEPYHLRPTLSHEVWLADNIYSLATCMQEAIDRYRQAIERTHTRGLCEKQNRG